MLPHRSRSFVQIKRQNIGLTVDDSLMRVYVASPECSDSQYPGILFYSDIYQLGRPITLLADRLAGDHRVPTETVLPGRVDDDAEAQDRE